MLIYTTMRDVQGVNRRQTPGVHVGVCFSSNVYRRRPGFPSYALRNSAHQAGRRQCHTGVYDVTVWMMSECFPVKEQGPGEEI